MIICQNNAVRAGNGNLLTSSKKLCGQMDRSPFLCIESENQKQFAEIPILM
jgi:hypothetical protein